MLKTRCPLCGAECGCSSETRIGGKSFHLLFHACSRCGQYVLGDDVRIDCLEGDRDEAFKIACVVQEKQLVSSGITYGIFGDGFHPTAQNIAAHLTRWWRIGELLAEFPKPTEMISRAMVNLSKLMKHPVQRLDLPWDRLSFLLFCPRELAEHQLRYMRAAGLIDKTYDTEDSADVQITPAGWKKLDEYLKATPHSKQAFGAMWFDGSMDKIEQAIKKGIDDAGYDPRIIKDKKHNNDICHEIIAEIRKSRFVVADFTAGCCSKCEDCEKNGDCRDKIRSRGGVYFEAGLAKGLGLEVIWLVREDQKDQIHFDTSHFNHIIYRDPTELAETLRVWIESTIR